MSEPKWGTAEYVDALIPEAKPTEVERLRDYVVKEWAGWIADQATSVADERAAHVKVREHVEALIAKVRAEALVEPTDDEWKTIYKASKFPDLISDNEALECAVFKFREIRGAK